MEKQKKREILKDILNAGKEAYKSVKKYYSTAELDKRAGLRRAKKINENTNKNQAQYMASKRYQEKIGASGRMTTSDMPIAPKEVKDDYKKTLKAYKEANKGTRYGK